MNKEREKGGIEKRQRSRSASGAVEDQICPLAAPDQTESRGRDGAPLDEYSEANTRMGGDPTEQTLVFASYNVHAWTGTDGQRDLSRIVRIIKGLKADIIGIQEATLPIDDDISKNQRELQERTGMHVAFGPTMLRKSHDFGNIILSRHPVDSIRRYDVSYRKREPRGAIELCLGIDGRSVRVCTTHLGLNAMERYIQARRLARQIFRYPLPDVVVAMGDMNDWLPGSPSLRPFLSRFGPSVSPRTFPSRCPVFALDRIFIRAKEQCSIETGVCGNREARLASDHLPVRSRVRFR